MANEGPLVVRRFLVEDTTLGHCFRRYFNVLKLFYNYVIGRYSTKTDTIHKAIILFIFSFLFQNVIKVIEDEMVEFLIKT